MSKLRTSTFPLLKKDQGVVGIIMHCAFLFLTFFSPARLLIGKAEINSKMLLERGIAPENNLDVW